ncbi:unnamed protein product [Cyclocybe aegerita]|uniref:Uncharacterized protein n=1 Tax=Cyclocybe aegerita TaxID=1973307 RepID=A0A8S0Y075_CYCAE|nr:unnamed protein product [Cyclocybe aegerita]
MSSTTTPQVKALPLADGEVDPKTVDISERGKADLAEDILQIIKNILDGILADDANRGKFTKAMVSTMYSKYPDFNWVCCHTAHSYNWDGTKGVEWAHFHEEFDLQIGGTIGYEIYWARSGMFALHGDGGFENWAYIGNVTGKSQDGRILVFSRP